MNVQFPELLPYLTEEQKKTLTIEQAIRACFLIEATVDVLEEEGREYDHEELVREVVQGVLDGEYQD